MKLHQDEFDEEFSVLWSIYIKFLWLVVQYNQVQFNNGTLLKSIRCILLYT
jgi:hypothetical protein